MEEGVGRSKREDLTIFKIGLVFVSWFFIRMLLKLFGWGGDHE